MGDKTSPTSQILGLIIHKSCRPSPGDKASHFTWPEAWKLHCPPSHRGLCAQGYPGSSQMSEFFPANTRHSSICGSMLGQRRRRWTNIDPPMLKGIPAHPRCLNSSQQTRDTHPFVDQCWASVVDAGPTLIHQWISVSCWYRSTLFTTIMPDLVYNLRPPAPHGQVFVCDDRPVWTFVSPVRRLPRFP